MYGWMWELDYKEGWVPKNWCSWTVVLEKSLESPSDCKETQPVHPKGNQSWIFMGRTDAEAEAPILRPPAGKNWLTGKDPDAGKDWRQEETGTRENEMVGWHHWLDGHEFEQTLGFGDGQGGLACCSPWGRRVRHDGWLNWADISRGTTAWCVYLSCQPALLSCFSYFILIQWFQWFRSVTVNHCIRITWNARFPWISWFHLQTFWFWNEV